MSTAMSHGLSLYTDTDEMTETEPDFDLWGEDEPPTTRYLDGAERVLRPLQSQRLADSLQAAVQLAEAAAFSPRPRRS